MAGNVRGHKQKKGSIMTEAVDSFVRPKTLAKLLGISKSLLYMKIKAGDIPSPLKIGQRVSVWPMSQVNELIDRWKSANDGVEQGRVEEGSGA